MTGELGEVCTALREAISSLVPMVRTIPDADAHGVGSWSVSDVAAHLSHTFRVDIDALAGRALPDATVTAPGMARLNADLLADDSERDPVVLAERLTALAEEFAETARRAAHKPSVEWLQRTGLRPATIAGHLLEECLIHGHDIATATGRPWPIQRGDALLALEAGVFPLIAALPPTAFLNQKLAGSLQARCELRLRGGNSATLVFDNGSLTVDATAGGAIDAYLCADPAAPMLVFIGRQHLWTPLVTGKLAAWGRRPWKLAHILVAMNLP